MTPASIPGYAYGDAGLSASPVSLQDLDLLQQSVLFTDADRHALAMAGEVLAPQVEDVLDVWYGFVAAHPHLVLYFADAQGRPIAGYLPPSASASASGFLTPAKSPGTRSGSTIKKRSLCVTTGSRRTRPMELRRPAISPCAT